MRCDELNLDIRTGKHKKASVYLQHTKSIWRQAQHKHTIE